MTSDTENIMWQFFKKKGWLVFFSSFGVAYLLSFFYVAIKAMLNDILFFTKSSFWTSVNEAIPTIPFWILTAILIFPVGRYLYKSWNKKEVL